MQLSVVICIYNPNFYLVEQLESILNSFRYVSEPTIKRELIFSDDSEFSDGKKLLGSLNAEFSYINGPASGFASDNFISALRKVSGDWVFLSDQDDIWDESKVQRYLQHIEHLDDSRPQIIFSDAFVVDSKGDVISNSFYSYQGLSINSFIEDEVLVRNCVQGATLCLNRKMIELIEDSLEGEESSDIVMHDWWIAILARYCGNWTFIDEPLLYYRQHGGNIIGASKPTSFIHRFINSPRAYLTATNQLKVQFQLWLRVSKKLGARSNFDQKNASGASIISSIKLAFLKLVSKF